jgi:hypothetical protein
VLSALPYVVVSQYLSLARVKRNIRALVLVQLALCVIILGLSVTLISVMGLAGVGVAWLAGQSILAIVLLLTVMRSQWIMQVNTQPIVHLASAPRRALQRVRRASHANQFNAILPGILASTKPLPGLPAPASWQVKDVISTLNDVKVALLGPRNGASVALLKVATTGFATESLQRRIETGERMWHDPRLAEWRAVLPPILAHGTAGGQGYVVKQKLAGVELRALAGQPDAFSAGQAAAVHTISQMHQRTGHLHRISEAEMSRWVYAPARVLREFSKANLQGGNYDRPIDSLIKTLDAALLRRELWVARIHGDFAPGNILVKNDGSKVTGLVDWEMSVENDLPQLDIMQLLLSSRMLERRREMGDVVLGLIKSEDWSLHELALFARSREVTGNDELGTQALLLMCWLRQVADTVQKSKRYTTSWVWSIKNVEQVLVRL